MRTQRRVFEKLSESTKVELASERIELKTLSQLKENIKRANSLIKLAEKEGNIFAKAEADLARAYSRFIKVRNELNYHAQRIIPMDNEDLMKKVRELGLKENDVPEIKKTKKLQSELMEYVKFYDDVKKYIPQV
jgi:hypothetical protein